MSKPKRAEEAPIPPHMLENPVSNAQKKLFAKVKRDEAKADEKDEKPAAKKADKK